MALHPHESTSFGRYTDLKQIHERNVRVLLQRGDFQPFFLYHALLLFCLPLIGLLIPRRWGTRLMRPGAFLLTVVIALDIIINRRTYSYGNGYGIGVLGSWWIIWSGNLLVIRDVEHDFARIERVKEDLPVYTTDANWGSTANSPSEGEERGHLEPRSIYESRVLANQRRLARKCHCNSQRAYTACTEQRNILYWQSYPGGLLHRLDWCLGLLLGFRGLEWNWRSPCMGPIPKSAHEVLLSGFNSSKIQIEDDARFQARKPLLVLIRTFLSSYALFDILRALMMEDSFFLGHIAAPEAVPSFPLSFIAPFPLLLQFYQGVLFLSSIYFGSNAVASGMIVIFIVFSLIFPWTFRETTYSPLDMPWVFAGPFGPFLSALHDHGLAGFWGRFWHQYLRYGFTTTAGWTLRFLPTTWRTNKTIKASVRLLVVFLLSGFLHACGSYTQLSETSMSRPFLFFFFQGVGLILESVFKTFVASMPPLRNMPQSIRATANSMFVVVWIFVTAPLFIDDLFKGGFFFCEIMPVSILGLLGIAHGGEWLHWSGPWFEYWSDGTYWGTGLRIV